MRLSRPKGNPEGGMGPQGNPGSSLQQTAAIPISCRALLPHSTRALSIPSGAVSPVWGQSWDWVWAQQRTQSLVPAFCAFFRKEWAMVPGWKSANPCSLFEGHYWWVGNGSWSQSWDEELEVSAAAQVSAYVCSPSLFSELFSHIPGFLVVLENPSSPQWSELITREKNHINSRLTTQQEAFPLDFNLVPFTWQSCSPDSQFEQGGQQRTVFGEVRSYK